jgi:hypothetical protein
MDGALTLELSTSKSFVEIFLTHRISETTTSQLPTICRLISLNRCRQHKGIALMTIGLHRITNIISAPISDFSQRWRINSTSYTKFAYIEGSCKVVHRSNTSNWSKKINMSIQQDSTKQVRYEIYSCTFCEFVQKSMETESLEAIDEKKYLFHLKHVHNLEP